MAASLVSMEGTASQGSRRCVATRTVSETVTGDEGSTSCSPRGSVWGQWVWYTHSTSRPDRNKQRLWKKYMGRDQWLWQQNYRCKRKSAFIRSGLPGCIGSTSDCIWFPGFRHRFPRDQCSQNKPCRCATPYGQTTVCSTVSLPKILPGFQRKTLHW